MEWGSGPTHAFPMGKRPVQIKNFIRDWRKFRQMTQEDLSEALDMSTANISKIERGETDIGLVNLADFARALKCHWLDLLTRPPSANENLWTLYSKARPGQRQTLERMAEALLNSQENDD